MYQTLMQHVTLQYNAHPGSFGLNCWCAAVRYLSFVFACGKACDKIVLLARMVESDPWIGKSSRITSSFPWHLWQNQKATSMPADTAKSS